MGGVLIKKWVVVVFHEVIRMGEWICGDVLFLDERVDL